MITNCIILCMICDLSPAMQFLKIWFAIQLQYNRRYIRRLCVVRGWTSRRVFFSVQVRAGGRAAERARSGWVSGGARGMGQATGRTGSQSRDCLAPLNTSNHSLTRKILDSDTHAGACCLKNSSRFVQRRACMLIGPNSAQRLVCTLHSQNQGP